MSDRSDCIEWPGAKNNKGYGVRKIGGRKGRLMLTHRLAWAEVHGPIPDGLCVLHRCDNPPCMNVDHLFLGTIAENAADMVAKGRAPRGGRDKTHCKAGHPYDEANTYRRPDRPGHRDCRTCRRDATRRWEART